MGLGRTIVDALLNFLDSRRKSKVGAIGQFWRDGGNSLLYDLPVTTGSLVIDAGGYEGEWSAGMIVRYGCRSKIYEPVPKFFSKCQILFKNNSLVQLHKAALGASNRKTTLCLLDNGTSEFRQNRGAQRIEADTIDVANIFCSRSEQIACFKINIEGGEYEVLERMIETNSVMLCDSLLIQFHREPDGYEARYKNIVAALYQTHDRCWHYEMIWEKWVLRASQL